MATPPAQKSHIESLPNEILRNIVDRLPRLDALSLKYSNQSCLYLIGAIAPGEAFTLEKSPVFKKWRCSPLGCRICQQLLSRRSFADKSQKGEKNRGGRKARTRVCLDCGLIPDDAGHAYYTRGTWLTIKDEQYVVCMQCGKFGQSEKDLGQRKHFCPDCRELIEDTPRLAKAVPYHHASQRISKADAKLFRTGKNKRKGKTGLTAREVFRKIRIAESKYEEKRAQKEAKKAEKAKAKAKVMKSKAKRDKAREVKKVKREAAKQASSMAIAEAKAAKEEAALAEAKAARAGARAAKAKARADRATAKVEKAKVSARAKGPEKKVSEDKVSKSKAPNNPYCPESAPDLLPFPWTHINLEGENAISAPGFVAKIAEKESKLRV